MWAIPCFVSAGGALVLGGALWGKRAGNPVFFPLTLLMLVLAWVQVFNGLCVIFPQSLFLFKQLILFGELAFPIALSYATVIFLKYLSPSSIAQNRTQFFLKAAGAIVLCIWLAVWPESVMYQEANGGIVFAQPAGWVFWGFILIAVVVGLSELEQILRGTRDPLRFQMKFVIIGLGGLAGIAIVQASQLFLLPLWTQTHAWVGGMATGLSLLLVVFGLARWRLQDFGEKFQVSHQALYTSFTFLLVGGYLVLVGIVTKVIQDTGWELGEALGALVVFAAGLGLVVILASRQARMELQQFIGRHFFRTKYDYRQTWLDVTEAFSACTDSQKILDRYLEWLGQTFGAPRVTIWKKFDVDNRFHQIRTINTEDPPPPIDKTHCLIQAMQVKKEPYIIDENDQARTELQEFLVSTEAHICVPLVILGENLIGFCTLSRELHDRSYDQDDCDLLRAVAHHVTMLLNQIRLAEEQHVMSKWEAVHKFSGFYLHDLKNLASSLSMVVQNADRYGQDPDFQASAMRTVRTTSQRIMDLMAKLAKQSKGFEADSNKHLQPVNMNELIQDTLGSLEGSGCQPTFTPGQDIPTRHMQVEPIKQVILNLILNARQAMNGSGTIHIATTVDSHDLNVEIEDTGPGIPLDRLEHLFQPFTSSKKTGLGVGLFQCKQIVEDNKGQIHIESQEGKGTKVILTFPAETTDI